MGVYKNGSVEVIANEQGNRATPAYLSFTAKERVVGEAGTWPHTDSRSPAARCHSIIRALHGFDPNERATETATDGCFQ